MLRTQIYLTETEREALQVMAAQTGRTQSDLIRDAIDHFIGLHQEGNRRKLLEKGRGLWKDRTDLPDFSALRRELDRPKLGDG
jgi:predicted transcriptional regulator